MGRRIDGSQRRVRALEKAFNTLHKSRKQMESLTANLNCVSVELETVLPPAQQVVGNLLELLRKEWSDIFLAESLVIKALRVPLKKPCGVCGNGPAHAYHKPELARTQMLHAYIEKVGLEA